MRGQLVYSQRADWPKVLLLPSPRTRTIGVHASDPIMATLETDAKRNPTDQEIDDESRRIRRLRILVQLTVETIADGGLSAEEAAGMIAATRRVALEMFPGKERAFDLIYRPQFQRVMHAVYRLQ